jgi:hypothetical protein
MEKFYIMDHGWATKYIWLKWLSEVDSEGENFIKLIKKGDVILTIFSGTTSGDIINSTAAITFYSMDFIKILEKYGIKLEKWPIKIILDDKSKKKIKVRLSQYYYIEPNSFVPFISWDSIYRYKENYIKRNKAKKELNKWYKDNTQVYCKGYKDNLHTWYFNIVSWGNSDLFGVRNSSIIVVSEKLKELVEKSNLKNIKFEELKLLTKEELKKEVEIFDT